MSATLASNLNRVCAVLGAALVLGTAAVLVTSSDRSTAGATRAGAVAAVDRVEIADFKFDPEGVSVAIGTTITWTNRDNAPHTATSGASAAPDGVFDTDIIRKGESKTVKLTKAGTYSYYCALHPFMHGTVVVR